MTGGALALAGAARLVDRLQVCNDGQHLLERLRIEAELAQAAQDVGSYGHVTPH